MNESLTSGSIVVGIDGSQAAIRATLWALDEAVSRDVPLLLLYVIEQVDAEEADELAIAETVLRHAVTAVEGTGRPVKIETEIDQGPAITSLTHASESAAMVCVGAVGLRHVEPGPLGATARALTTSARCPVAVVRGHDDYRRQPGKGIVVEVDGSAENYVLLSAAREEARLRNVAVQAVFCGRAIPGLDRGLDRCGRRYPRFGVESARVGSLLDYLAHNGRSVQLVIVDSHNQHLQELLEPTGSAILQGSDCSLLVFNHQHL